MWSIDIGRSQSLSLDGQEARMRGPHDDTLQALEARRDIIAATPEGHRSAGGKPLERLLMLLASKGYAQHAVAAVKAAVPDDAAKPLLARIEQYPNPAAPEGRKRKARVEEG